MTPITPYLTFNGNCREAMEFYQSCMGGELKLTCIKDMPPGIACPEGMEDHVMHSELQGDGFLFMATDMVAPGGFKAGNNFSMCMQCNSEEELKGLFGKIMEGGQVAEEPKVQFWGDIMGFGVDRFGIAWMLNCPVAAHAVQQQ